MNEETLQKLVDLYAERELPAELEDPLETAAARDSALRREMTSLRSAIERVRRDPGDPTEYDDEVRLRLLQRIAEPADRVAGEPEDSRFQYSLPYAPPNA